MEVMNDGYQKERRGGRFSSLDSSFLRDKLLKKYNKKTTNPDSTSPYTGNIGIESIQNVQKSTKTELIQYKENLITCAKVYNFAPTEPSAEREQKTKILQELLDALDSGIQNEIFSHDIISLSFDMIRNNLFRPFHFIVKPSSATTTIYEAEDEETMLEASWPHLILVYQFFLRLIIFPQFDQTMAIEFMDPSFIKQFIWLFHSEDARERDMLKNLLHRIFGKFVCLRPAIVKSVKNSLIEFVYENAEESNGICELLEVFESIVSGFKVPIKEENIQFLQEYLIPLHKSRALPNFHQQLSKCMAKFIQKELRCATIIYNGILKYWPVTNSIKEVNYLNEVEELIETCNGTSLQNIEKQLFKKLCKCICSPHFQVAEKALLMLNNEKIIDILSRNKPVLYPKLVGSLLENSENHWNNYITTLTLNSVKVLMDLDMKLFEISSKKHQEEKSEKGKKRANIEEKWKKLELQAKK